MAWAVILCNLSDVSPTADARNRYVQYFTQAGSGTGGAFDYWRDIYYGRGGLLGTEVFVFFDIMHHRAELNSFSGQQKRRQIFAWGMKAAARNGVDATRFEHKIVVLNVSADHVSVGDGVVLAYEDTRPLEPTFISHEMGHEFGLDHSFGEQPNPCAGGDGRPGAYCDVFDIMSAMNVRSFRDSQGRVAGPSLAGFSRVQLGWLDGSRVWKPGATPLETIKLAALNRPEINGFLLGSSDRLRGG